MMEYNETLGLHLGDMINVLVWKEPEHAQVVGFTPEGKPVVYMQGSKGNPIDGYEEHIDNRYLIEPFEETDRFWTLSENDCSLFQHEQALGIQIGEEILVGRTDKGYLITGPDKLWDTTGKYPPLKATVIGFKRDAHGSIATQPLVAISRRGQKFRRDIGYWNSQKEDNLFERYEEKIGPGDEFDFNSLLNIGDAFVYLTDTNAFKMDTATAPELTTSKEQGETIMSNNKSVMDMVKDDAANAMYRVASHQISKGVKTAILALLERQGSNSDGLKAASEMLDTEMGSAIISLLLGLGIGNLPIEAMKEDHRVQKIAEELRIGGMATAGNVAMEMVMEHIMPVIMGVLTSLPPAETQARVASSTSKSVEKEAYLEEEIKIPNKQARV